MASSKFDFIVNLTHSHNDVLVRVLNCSTAEIAKYKKGVLQLPSNEESIENLSVFFAQKIRDDIQEKGASIFFANGMPWPKDLETASELIKRWLMDPSQISETQKKDFLYSIACMYAGISETSESGSSFECVPEHLQTIPDHSNKTKGQVESDLGPATSISYGDINKRNTVLSILEELDKTDKAYHFTIYSEAGIKWFTDDADYFSKWYSLLQSILSKGSTMDLITNLVGDDNYFAGGVKMWLNLFGTGQLQVYQGYAPSNLLVYRTLFAVNNTVAFASYSYSYESSDQSVNIKVESPDEVRRITEINMDTIRNCIPLFKMYSLANLSDFLYDLATYRTLAGDTYIASRTPALFTMPDSIIDSISERCSTEFWKKMAGDERAYFKRLMHDNTVVEILNLPPVEDVMSGKVLVPYTDIFCTLPVYFEPEELLAHLKNLARFKLRNPQYRLIISKRIIPELSMEIKEEIGAFLTIHNNNGRSFFLNHHGLVTNLLRLIKKLVAVHAIKTADNSMFDKYISDLENRIKRKSE